MKIKISYISFYCSIGLLASLTSLFWLLIESDLSNNTGITSVSPLLILLILLCASGIIFFSLIIRKSSSDNAWAAVIEDKIIMHLSNKEIGDRVFALSLYGLFLGSIFLWSIETRSDFRITNALLDSFIAARSLMNRIEPVVFWAVIMFGLNILLMNKLSALGIERYRRVLKPFAYAIIPILSIVVYIISQIDERYLKEIFREDNLLEWITFWILLLAGALGGIRSWQVFKKRSKSSWFFALFAISLFLFAMEEISWGQRVFQIESTEFFLQNSDQQEINVHNVLQKWGDFKTYQVAGIVLFIFGGLLPIANRNPRINAFFNNWGIVIPQSLLISAFTLSAAMMLPGLPDSLEELGELSLSICLLLFIVFEFLKMEDR